jgi:hypothetical protein
MYRYWTYFRLRGDNQLLKPSTLNLALNAVRKHASRITHRRILNALRNLTSRGTTTAWNFTYRNCFLYKKKFYLKRQDDYVRMMIMIMMICNTFTVHWKRNFYPDRTQYYNRRRRISVHQSTTCNGRYDFNDVMSLRCLWRRQTCTCRTSRNGLGAKQPLCYFEPSLYLARIQLAHLSRLTLVQG